VPASYIALVQTDLLASSLCSLSTISPAAEARADDVCSWPIVLQKSKVAGRRIFRETPKREAPADSHDLNRITEVACEYNVRR